MSDSGLIEPKRTWREALAVYLRPRVIGMLFFGFSAGLPFLLVFSTLTAWLREEGVDHAAIGFFAWIGILYSIKVFWAPIVDRVPLPWLTRLLGKRRGWMLTAQFTIVLGLLLMARVDPATDLALLAWLALLVAFASATQDICIDAYRIEAVPDEQQASMAAVYITGYRLAIIAAGAGALYIADFLTWKAAYETMAALGLVGVCATLVAREPERHISRIAVHREQRVIDFVERRAHWPVWIRGFGEWFVGAVVCPLVDFFERNGRHALVLLLLVAVFKISDLSMAAMAQPLYIDLGFSLSEIASITKVFGVAVTIFGGFIGGVMVLRYGIMPMLLFGALTVAGANLLFAWLAGVGDNLTALTLVISADNFSNGFSATIFIAWLSSLTSRAYTATQYALFSSLMTLPGKAIGGWSGVVVETAGYPVFFIYAAALGLPAVALILYMMKTGVDGRVREENGQS